MLSCVALGEKVQDASGRGGNLLLTHFTPSAVARLGVTLQMLCCTAGAAKDNYAQYLTAISPRHANGSTCIDIKQ